MANKKITMYELMGLIKDGKAPKKVRITGNIYEFDEELNTYITRERNCRILLGGVTGEINLIANIFNEIVEILPEENDEWEDIEEIKNIDDFAVGNLTELNSKVINKLIKNQKYLKERLESKDDR